MSEMLVCIFSYFYPYFRKTKMWSILSKKTISILIISSIWSKKRREASSYQKPRQPPLKVGITSQLLREVERSEDEDRWGLGRHLDATHIGVSRPVHYGKPGRQYPHVFQFPIQALLMAPQAFSPVSKNKKDSRTQMSRPLSLLTKFQKGP